MAVYAEFLIQDSGSGEEILIDHSNGIEEQFRKGTPDHDARMTEIWGDLELVEIPMDSFCDLLVAMQ